MVNIKIDYKKDIWLYALIAFILIIIAVFTPWGSIEVSGVNIYSWVDGLVMYVDGDLAPLYIEGWNGAGVHLWTTFLVAFCAALLLFYGIHSWKGMEFKWDWLVYLLIGIVLILFPILALTVEATEGGVIGFAPIGFIIAGAVCIVAFIMKKFIAGRGGA